MPKSRYVIDGQPWVPISHAAKLLGTNALGVWKLIEEGTLPAQPSRAGSSITVVNLVWIANLRAEREQFRKERDPRKPKKPKPAASSPLAPRAQRIPGHREQMALPMPDAGRKSPWKRED